LDLFIHEKEALVRGMRFDGWEKFLKILFMKAEDSSKKGFERCFGSWSLEMLLE
jgi:hypothetical protein